MNIIRSFLVSACLCCMAVCLTAAVGRATPPKAPERINAVMVGDRLVDVSLKLGVIPEGMSVRLSMWPDKAQGLPLATQVLGCPNFVTTKHPETIPDFMKRRGITLIILEKSRKFCLYKQKVNPVQVADLVKDVPGVRIEYVDFTRGVPAAIARTAELLDRAEEGGRVAATYEAAMKKVEAELPPAGLGRRVLVLNGKYLAANGKGFIRLEAPGGYTDQYILDPLGCTNASSGMLTDTMKVTKGHVSVSRMRGLAKANPDVIVATGDGFAVQKALRDALKRDPSLAEVPALKNGEVYSLPFYGDSSILEYPLIFRQWQKALTP